jgi:hypothetical protein
MQDTTNLRDVIASEKPKKGSPLLLLLIFLIIIVLGGVGFLAYQNYQLAKNTKTPAQTLTTLPTPTVEPSVTYKIYASKILPIEVMLPENWQATESANPKLGNQKVITAQSPDLNYQGSTISAGFYFTIGPVTDLTKKYNSFDEFTLEEGKTNTADLVVFNGIKFLKSGTSAKTLIEKTPVTITLYTSSDNSNKAIEFFNKILASFKLINTSSEAEVIATPSAKPSI